MAEALKNHFGNNIPEILANRIVKVYPAFKSDEFIKQALSGFDSLELLPRGRKLALDLHPFLPVDFAESVSILKQTMNEAFSHTKNEKMATFFYMPHLHFIAQFGLPYFDEAMAALHYMTQRFSAEFAIRPFIENYPEKTFQLLHKWKTDPNFHVRRLVSEGTRPLLPWASKLRFLEKDPSLSIPLLEHLVHDSELYVRRSVANHLNDISKNQPELVLSICEKWSKNASETTYWVIKQALRTLIKKGNPKAIHVLGFDSAQGLEISSSNINPTQIHLGEQITFSFDVVNTSAKSSKVILDFEIQFRKANGKTGTKVFKLSTTEIKPKETQTFSKTLFIKELSTRKHYSGIHSIQVLVNGKVHLLGDFLLHC